MHVRSLALITELALAETRGLVLDRDDYIVVQTPDDPGYYYGNLLVLPAAPQVGEVAYWSRRFTDELGDDPEIRHVTFRWDGTTGDTGASSELLAAGFVLEVGSVLTARQLAYEPAGSYEARELRPDEVLATADLRWTIGDRHDERYRKFLHRRATWQRDLVTRGLARFWGTFEGDELVGSLGLVTIGELSRYQDVQTAASHRGRGIASTLLLAAAAEATGELVIIAEPGSAAARLYERVGFRAVEQTASACKSPATG